MIDFIEKDGVMIVYGEDAKEWCGYTLQSMKERMAWEFPEVIEEWLYEFIAEVGFPINKDLTSTIYFWDNPFINGEWGLIDSLKLSKKEAKKLYEEGELLFYDKKSGYYVKSL